MNIEKIKSEFKLKPFGAKGWMRSDLLPCAWCGRSDKFGLILNSTGKSSYNCFHGSCGEKGSLKKLFLKMDRKDLLDEEDVIVTVDRLDGNLVKKKNISNKAEIIKLPLKFTRIYQDDYLDKRGFTPQQYKIFEIGETIDPKFKNHLVFVIRENGEVVGYLGRTKFSKDWHKENLKNSKLGLCKLLPRYQNASGVDFEKIIGGYDEIVDGETETVIIVEGLMDKQNIDLILDLYSSNETKCIFTFGNSISEIQIQKLVSKKVKNCILLYDYGTIKQSQQFGLSLSRYFKTYVCEIKTPDRDPGDFTYEEFNEVLSNAISPFKFSISKIANIDLK